MSASRPSRTAPLAFAALPMLVGCSGPQSSLDPAGADAQAIAGLFWAMAAGALLIWIWVVGLAWSAARRPRTEGQAMRHVIGGGLVLPTLVLAALLAWSFSLMTQRPASRDGLHLVVTGELWWWRVRYQSMEHGPVELANEIRLPAGERLELRLLTREILHSLWIPSLGGKLDMVPGRENRLTLAPFRAGVYNGVCAEYCGTGHARMAFPVVVVDPAEFASWLAGQAAPAAIPSTPLAAQGQQAFLAHGCAACHAIRGTAAAGAIGPDLTHVASRRTLGAGTLSFSTASLKRWISDPAAVKPGARMPAFHMLPAAQLDALAAYLGELR